MDGCARLKSYEKIEIFVNETVVMHSECMSAVCEEFIRIYELYEY